MQILNNFSLRPFNTFGIEAIARHFATFSTVEELKELLSEASHSTKNNLVLGGGSNILFTKNVDGFVLKNELSGINLVDEDENHFYVKAAAGENWHKFVLFCIQHNYAGLENLSLIPGNVGTSPMQNIGAYGVEIKDVFVSLEALHKKELEIKIFTKDECRFGYRESVFKSEFKDQFVILNVTFRLNKVPVFNTSYGAIQQELDKMGIKDLSIQAISQAVINIRSSKLPDPKQIGNAGSFFKNPTVDIQFFQSLQNQFPDMPYYTTDVSHVKIPAAWLIQQCGWKGYRKGDAGVHVNQPLVLVNYGNASGDEIFNLSENILKSVQEKFNITLEREVNIV
ncbi:MAG: UDP-N-acetylmuramate dehydrogenase [Bacteroidetes bacterium]|nr:UDP-N-acetylmuramate dehydrogenase [Bacteroidota bacterium]